MYSRHQEKMSADVTAALVTAAWQHMAVSCLLQSHTRSCPLVLLALQRTKTRRSRSKSLALLLQQKLLARTSLSACLTAQTALGMRMIRMGVTPSPIDCISNILAHATGCPNLMSASRICRQMCSRCEKNLNGLAKLHVRSCQLSAVGWWQLPYLSVSHKTRPQTSCNAHVKHLCSAS